MGKIDLWGRVGLAAYQGYSKMTLAIKSHTRENATILGVFWAVFGL